MCVSFIKYSSRKEQNNKIKELSYTLKNSCFIIKGDPGQFAGGYLQL